MGNTTLVLKKVETFPLVIEIDCAAATGKLTLDCRVMSKPDIVKLQEKGLSDPEYFAEIVTAVHGAPGPDGAELEGKDALDFVTNGPLSAYLLVAFVGAYFEQFGDARRKNGQRLRAR